MIIYRYLFLVIEIVYSIEGMKFFVINCEDKKAWSPITFGDMFISKFGIKGDEWTVCNIARGEPLPVHILDYNGVLLTGSHYNCRHSNMGIAWFDQLFQFVRDANEHGYPNVYGSCFGAQVIARALGGSVDFNPGNRYVLKIETLHVLPDFFTYLADKGEEGKKKSTFSIINTHEDCVASLPPHAISIATSASCVHEAFVAGRHRKHFLGVQGHPEFDLQYAVLDRIWPAVALKKNRLSDHEMTDARQSFDKFSSDDSDQLCRLISHFLHTPIDASTTSS